MASSATATSTATTVFIHGMETGAKDHPSRSSDKITFKLKETSK